MKEDERRARGLEGRRGEGGIERGGEGVKLDYEL